jgi:hypothetical protein
MGALSVLVAVAVLVPTSAWAQGTTGTIRGKVNDMATGDPLAAVNVFVLETDGTVTQMGAFTNTEGEYVIINVPPGRYMLRATMMGYKTYQVEELLVTVGVSTVQDFTLEATVLDVGEVVTVTAERDMIQRDVTATQQSYTIDEMERMAVSTTTDILSLQTNAVTLADGLTDWIPGYRDRGLEQVHMRGGRNAEVAFMIDGMQVTNLVFGGQAASVSPFSLSEMVIMAGGMSAEFGNAMSGVVNMVTREGGVRYDANVEVLTSEFTGQEQDDAKNLTETRGYLGGPIPLIPKFSFFLSGQITTRRDYVLLRDDIVYDLTPSTPTPDFEYPLFEDDNNPYYQIGPDDKRVYPNDVYSGWLGYGIDNRHNGMLNLTYKLTPQMKLVLSGQYNGRWGYPYTFGWRYSMLWGKPEWWQDQLTWGVLAEEYDPVTDTWTTGTDLATEIVPLTGSIVIENEKNLLTEGNIRGAFVWTHQINPSTFYSLRGSYYGYKRDMRVRRFVNDDGYMSRRSHYFVDAGEDTYWTPDDPMHEVELVWIPHSYYHPNYGSTDSVDIHERIYGYTSYGSHGHGMSGSRQGSDRYFSNYYDYTRTLKGDVTSQVTSHHQVKTGFLYNYLTIDTFDLQILWYDPPYRTEYRRSPWEFGFYLQDKIEYDFMIVNLGIRYDSANAGKIPYWADPRNPIHPETGELVLNPFLTEVEWNEMTAAEQERFELPPLSTGSLRGQWSPRMGISHPVTDQAVIYFNYGHFFQNPVYRNIYLMGTLEDAVPLLGNPNMDNEKTVSYEFGYKHQFTDIYAMEVTMWARDTSNMVGSEVVPSFFAGAANPYEYTTFVNYDYSSAKGVDLALLRRYSGYFSARANYSFMTTQSNRDDPWSGYREDHTLESTPKRPRVLGWDQPHRFSAMVSLSIPQGAGPAVGGLYPLSMINASLIYRANAGRPYTPRTKDRALEPNSGRRPWTFQWDLRLYKDFETFGLRYSLFADVRNLFDRKNVVAVWARTGKADDPGPGITYYSDYYDRTYYYGTPRTINLGLRLYF